MSDLLEKEKAYRESENEADEDTDSKDSSDGEETASEESDSEEVIQTKKSCKKNSSNHVIIVKLDCVCHCGAKMSKLLLAR